MGTRISFLSLLLISAFLSNATTYASDYQVSKAIFEQVESRDIDSIPILDALKSVDRLNFVPTDIRSLSYQDLSLPLGQDGLIQSPYLLGAILKEGEVIGAEKCLELGTGVGYQTAVLSRVCREVFTVDKNYNLSLKAQSNLNKLGVDNVTFLSTDPENGWPALAPFDVIIYSLPPKSYPQKTIEQLSLGGQLIMTVGTANEDLQIINKAMDGEITFKRFHPPYSFKIGVLSQ